MNLIDLTPLFRAIITLLAALITYKLIPWIKSKTTESQQNGLAAAARTAVYAAEQVFGSGQGQDKLNYALEALRKAGYNLDKTLAVEAIERAVREMNIYDKAQFPLFGIPADDEDEGDGDDETYDEPAPGAPAIKQVYEVPTQPEVDEGAAEIFAGTEPVSMDEIGEHQAPGIVDPPPDGGK